MRVVIVTENASRQQAGEASLAFYYFKLLRSRNVEVWMVCHARVKEELRAIFEELDFQKIHFIKETQIQNVVRRIGSWVPYRVRDKILWELTQLVTQYQARKVVKNLLTQQDIQIVFQPAPISPKEPSFMYGLGVPVVIGPMCGGIDLPPAFQYMDSPLTQALITNARLLSSSMHQLIPGKLQADALIVANERTAKALPKGCRGKIYEVVESGVDFSIWKLTKRKDSQLNQIVRFVYSGRFVDWKGIQFLIKAFRLVADQTNSVLELIGDGLLRDSLEAQVATLKLEGRVHFHGWMQREDSAKLIRDCNVFVMPSLRECGGTAILEAMAMGLPIIATKWAGPANYVNSTCGILVEPTSQQAFVDGLAAAMIYLAESAEIRCQMSEASRQRITQNYFDWDSKTERVLEILTETLKLYHQATNRIGKETD